MTSQFDKFMTPVYWFEAFQYCNKELTEQIKKNDMVNKVLNNDLKNLEQTLAEIDLDLRQSSSDERVEILTKKYYTELQIKAIRYYMSIIKGPYND